MMMTTTTTTTRVDIVTGNNNSNRNKRISLDNTNNDNNDSIITIEERQRRRKRDILSIFTTVRPREAKERIKILKELRYKNRNLIIAIKQTKQDRKQLLQSSKQQQLFAPIRICIIYPIQELWETITSVFH